MLFDLKQQPNYTKLFMMLKKTPQLVLYCSLLKGHQPKTEYTHFVAVEIKMLAGIKVT
jgi:hypothetical protein